MRRTNSVPVCGFIEGHERVRRAFRHKPVDVDVLERLVTRIEFGDRAQKLFVPNRLHVIAVGCLECDVDDPKLVRWQLFATVGQALHYVA